MEARLCSRISVVQSYDLTAEGYKVDNLSFRKNNPKNYFQVFEMHTKIFLRVKELTEKAEIVSFNFGLLLQD